MAKSKMNIKDYNQSIATFERFLSGATSEEDKVRFSNALAGLKKKRDEFIADNYEKRRQKLITKIKEVSGMDFDIWWETVKRMYTVTDDFTVVSKAKDWKEAKTWKCGSEIGAQEKILELVGYKELDRNRGFGSYEADLERVRKLETDG